MHNKRNNHPNANLPIIKILIDPSRIESKLRCQNHIANTQRNNAMGKTHWMIDCQFKATATIR